MESITQIRLITVFGGMVAICYGFMHLTWLCFLWPLVLPMFIPIPWLFIGILAWSGGTVLMAPKTIGDLVKAYMEFIYQYKVIHHGIEE